MVTRQEEETGKITLLEQNNIILLKYVSVLLTRYKHDAAIIIVILVVFLWGIIIEFFSGSVENAPASLSSPSHHTASQTNWQSSSYRVTKLKQSNSQSQRKQQTDC